MTLTYFVARQPFLQQPAPRGREIWLRTRLTVMVFSEVSGSDACGFSSKTEPPFALNNEPYYSAPVQGSDLFSRLSMKKNDPEWLSLARKSTLDFRTCSGGVRIGCRTTSRTI